MHPYGVRDVEKLLRLPRSTIRALIAAGFVSPARGPRSAWLFSFQDLIVLRTAQALADAKVPQRRITKSVRELRRHLPDAMPLSGLSICAVADRVVVREGGSRWQAESGQYLLEFEGDPADGSLSVIERQDIADAPSGAQNWFDRGVALERVDAEAAREAYEQAIVADRGLLDAYINLGRLLHEARRFAKAEQVYREGVKACGSDPMLLYNLGVLLDDMDRKAEAMAAYETALRGNPGLADCHYNLALLCKRLGRPKEAIRHMSRYRTLVGDKTR
ncbi:MAG TPA: tetratricopeptide repeat protein [Casimicrobiaceae bacterium]|nr:tetratricopeptide repeat protein [Casimicrobiaceae bacterium]